MALTHVCYEAEGWGVGELWLDGDRVVEHELPRPMATADKPRVASRVPGTELAERLCAFFAGEAVEFDDVDVVLDDDTPFRRELAKALCSVSRGEVVSYGELAALAGRPGAARAAGTFCARNRLPIFVPCHRVVSAGGLGAYGSLGVEYKRRLLALEGVAL
jgi:methylated-DNA-[protein]-cysteine S-methyltransferase